MERKSEQDFSCTNQEQNLPADLGTSKSQTELTPVEEEALPNDNKSFTEAKITMKDKTKPGKFLFSQAAINLETRSATLSSIPLRPESRGLGSRTSSRQGSRKIISRSSSRKSRGGSSVSRQAGDQIHSSGSESEDDSRRVKRADSLDIMTTMDITDDKAWDTDLEEKEPSKTYDHTGKTAYVEKCKQHGVIPASYFLRHMHDRKLDMKHHGLGATGIKPIATSLATNNQILSLDLSDNWLGLEGGIAVCEMLKENCFITELNLSENHLGSKCAPPLCHFLLQNDTLRKVTLAGNGFDDKAAPYFAELILNTKTLEHLNLSHNSLGEVAGVLLGPAISENSSIKELDLSWNFFRRKGAVALALGIKTNVFMKKVNLSWNGLSLEGAVALGDALKGNSVLEELDITNNRIMTEGAVLIGKGLAVNETLQVLKMGKNPMESAGCYGVCAALLRNPSSILHELDFSDVLVNTDFDELFAKVKEQMPNLILKHGGTEPPLKPKARVHPMVKVTAYIKKHNLRLVDFFNKFDKDHSMSVTQEEFVQGLERLQKVMNERSQETGINLTDDEIQLLLEELDKDGDGEINYSEMVIGHQDFQEMEKKNKVVTMLRPTTA